VIATSEWHPIAVHFPMALVITGVVMLTAARFWERRRATLATVGTWNLCLGALAALVALATGLAALASIELSGAARAAVSLHVRWAIFTTLGALLLASWRGAGAAQESRPSPWFLGVLWALVAALVVTGYRGGQNVYQYGVGVSRAPIAAGHPSEEQRNE
jgi:uncharacterized membrane protein